MKMSRKTSSTTTQVQKSAYFFCLADKTELATAPFAFPSRDIFPSFAWEILKDISTITHMELSFRRVRSQAHNKSKRKTWKRFYIFFHVSPL